MYNKKFWILLLSALTFTSLHAALPYTFSSGGAIRASEINANFTYLNNLIANRTYIRASKTWSSDSASPQSIYSVAAGEGQHLITFIQYPSCSSGATLTIGADRLFLGSTASQITGLNIPVNAGENISIECQTGGLNVTRTTLVVLAK
jgi:hypothetical protein